MNEVISPLHYQGKDLHQFMELDEIWESDEGKLYAMILLSTNDQTRPPRGADDIQQFCLIREVELMTEELQA